MNAMRLADAGLQKVMITTKAGNLSAGFDIARWFMAEYPAGLAAESQRRSGAIVVRDNVKYWVYATTQGVAVKETT